MRKLIAFLMIFSMLFTALPVAVAVSKTEYTLPTKTGTVLQSTPDRGIAPQTEAARHPLIEGESPVTGLPWEGEYLPMLVQIGNLITSTKIGGRTIKTSGVGKAAPWGGQYADIVYESMIVKNDATRLTFLYSDCFALGEPKGEVGPVRSTRIGQLILREEWQAGFVYGGGFAGTFSWRDQQTPELLAQTGALTQGVLLNMLDARYTDYRRRVKGVKAPNNRSVNLIGLRETIPDTFVSQPRPFLFSDESPYTEGYDAADTIHLDWGREVTISHFVYDASQNVYLRYCGAGTKAAKWAPFVSYATADDRSEEHQQQFTFSNVIIQRVEYTYENEKTILSDMQLIGKGNADIFISGRYIPGYWVRASMADPTVYYDDQGNELVLARGKTYIAQFPPEGLCTFTSEP
jgi:hypothetical protein